MAVNEKLRDDQIAATLARFGYPADTVIKGIRYEGQDSLLGPKVSVAVDGANLIVPPDVLAMPAPAREEKKRKRLFSRPE